MSTAGKVLVVLVMLASLVWIVLAAGVAQLNTNGNKRLHDLAEQVEQAPGRSQARLKTTSLRCAIRPSTVQENVDRELTVLRVPPVRPRKGPFSDPGKPVSSCNTSSRSSQETIDQAKDGSQHRNDEAASRTAGSGQGEDRKSKS